MNRSSFLSRLRDVGIVPVNKTEKPACVAAYAVSLSVKTTSPSCAVTAREILGYKSGFYFLVTSQWLNFFAAFPRMVKALKELSVRDVSLVSFSQATISK